MSSTSGTLRERMDALVEDELKHIIETVGKKRKALDALTVGCAPLLESGVEEDASDNVIDVDASEDDAVDDVMASSSGNGGSSSEDDGLKLSCKWPKELKSTPYAWLNRIARRHMDDIQLKEDDKWWRKKMQHPGIRAGVSLLELAGAAGCREAEAAALRIRVDCADTEEEMRALMQRGEKLQDLFHAQKALIDIYDVRYGRFEALCNGERARELYQAIIARDPTWRLRYAHRLMGDKLYSQAADVLWDVHMTAPTDCGTCLLLQQVERLTFPLPEGHMERYWNLMMTLIETPPMLGAYTPVRIQHQHWYWEDNATPNKALRYALAVVIDIVSDAKRSTLWGITDVGQRRRLFLRCNTLAALLGVFGATYNWAVILRNGEAQFELPADEAYSVAVRDNAIARYNTWCAELKYARHVDVARLPVELAQQALRAAHDSWAIHVLAEDAFQKQTKWSMVFRASCRLLFQSLTPEEIKTFKGTKTPFKKLAKQRIVHIAKHHTDAIVDCFLDDVYGRTTSHVAPKLPPGVDRDDEGRISYHHWTWLTDKPLHVGQRAAIFNTLLSHAVPSHAWSKFIRNPLQLRKLGVAAIQNAFSDQGMELLLQGLRDPELSSDCVFCLDSLMKSPAHTTISIFLCGHTFHASCATQWDKKCPTCRQTSIKKTIRTTPQLNIVKDTLSRNKTSAILSTIPFQ
jgi:hypothetical protein